MSFFPKLIGSRTHCSKIDEFPGIHANGATEVSGVVSVIIVNNNTGSPKIVVTKSWGKRALYNWRISEIKKMVSKVNFPILLEFLLKKDSLYHWFYRLKDRKQKFRQNSVKG